MPDPIAYPATTTHLSFPLLFTGQAQKEPFINQTFSAVDALLTGVVDNALGTPPNNPAEGSRYRVTENATDDWQGHDDEIAINVAGAWQFVAPHDGMRVFDSTAKQSYFFHTGAWQAAAEPAPAAGGSVIDSEAREVLETLIEALKTAGIFVQTS